METDQLRPLSMVKQGQTVKVARIAAGRGLNIRLASMGILPNVQLTVIRNSQAGPFVISIKNSRMMLGRGVAHKIMVF